jgi:D-alanyl-lipoteichoic acid acyltransferase DltB (MBOAT superfamily)
MEIPENFNRPYLATNFLDFWSRWHITLSEWFKFYLFNPLTKELLRVVDRPALAPWLGAVGFFVTFFVMGLWHGTSDRFVVYGLLLGAGVSLNKAWQVALTKRMGRRPYAALCARRWYRILARSLALSYFAFALILIWFDLDALWYLAQGLELFGCLMAVGSIFLVMTGFVLLVEVAQRIPWPTSDGLAVGVTVGIAQAAGIAYYLYIWRGYVPELVYQRF